MQEHTGHRQGKGKACEGAKRGVSRKSKSYRQEERRKKHKMSRFVEEERRELSEEGGRRQLVGKEGGRHTESPCPVSPVQKSSAVVKVRQEFCLGTMHMFQNESSSSPPYGRAYTYVTYVIMSVGLSCLSICLFPVK